MLQCVMMSYRSHPAAHITTRQSPVAHYYYPRFSLLDFGLATGQARGSWSTVLPNITVPTVGT